MDNRNLKSNQIWRSHGKNVQIDDQTYATHIDSDVC